MEHRTTSADVAPPWYKRGTYLMIIAIVLIILVFAVYYLFISPVATTSTYVPPPSPIPNYSAGQGQ